ncbi:MAG: PepSY-associated TM helix domain-containing protein [Pseudomonadota bacterium]
MREIHMPEADFPVERGREQKAKSRRGLKKLYNLHAWVGFQLAIVMFVILFTGTIATISNEIDWLIFENLRASENTENKPKPTPEDLTKMYLALKEAYPEGSIRSLVDMGESYFTYRSFVVDESLGNNFVQIDQWTQEIKGTVPRLTVQRFFRDFHRYLFMPSFPGIIVVCAFAFILGISLYTGLKTTRNWRTALWRLRTNQGARIALSDSHKVAGLWGIWFVFIMVVTGVWYLYEFSWNVSGNRMEPLPAAIERNIGEFKSAEEKKDAIAKIPLAVMNEKNLLKMFTLAQNAHSDWDIKSIYFSPRADRPIDFRGTGNNPLLRDRAYRVLIDPVSLEINQTFSPNTISTHAYINEYIDPIHFGYFGGVWSKFIWFVFGLTLTAMSLTGVLMTWKRTKSNSVTRAQVATIPILVLSVVAFVFWIQRFS